MENRFNLIEERWIPIVSKDRVSLLDVFTDFSLKEISGNAIQKAALYRLLIAIAQRASSIKTNKMWREKGVSGVSKECIDYLKSHKEDFYLYGDRPFLQVKELSECKEVKVQDIFFDYQPDIASDNDTILKESQAKQKISDAEKAVFIVSLMNYALGGKRTSYPKTYLNGKDAKMRKKSAKSAPSIGRDKGFLQTMFLGESIAESVFLNLFSEEELELNNIKPDYSVLPPWEKMPSNQDPSYWDVYKKSLYSWFVAVSRFVLLCDEGIKYCEGIIYETVKEGLLDPFISIDNKRKAICVDPAKKPWRELPALLNAVYSNDNPDAFKCLALTMHLTRNRDVAEYISIWSGGLKIRQNSGDQSVKQSDDYVDSKITLADSDIQDGFFYKLSLIMKDLDSFGSYLHLSIEKYYGEMKIQKKSSPVTSALASFWSYVESYSQDIFDYAEEKDVIEALMNKIWDKACDVYDEFTSRETARQFSCWVKFKPYRKIKESK